MSPKHKHENGNNWKTYSSYFGSQNLIFLCICSKFCAENVWVFVVVVFFQEKATRCKTNITNEMLLINVTKVFFTELFIV